MEIIGYHGTSQAAAEKIEARDFAAVPENQYRWLGNGIYFFEDSHPHAAAWAKIVVARNYRKNPDRPASELVPAVVRAKINLRGGCLDLADPYYLGLLRNAQSKLIRTLTRTGQKLPQQKPFTVAEGEVLAGYWDEYEGFGKNELDCAVINYACVLSRSKENMAIRTVRGIFTEGFESYDTSWIFDKCHVAIAVRHPFDAMTVEQVSKIGP